MFDVIVNIILVAFICYVVIGISFLVLSYLFYGRGMKFNLRNILVLIFTFPFVEFEEKEDDE